MGCALVFLGTVVLLASCGGRIWPAAFGPLLEHEALTGCALPHRAFISRIIINYAEPCAANPLARRLRNSVRAVEQRFRQFVYPIPLPKRPSIWDNSRWAGLPRRAQE